MSNKKIRRDSLLYHAKPIPGKIQVVPTKKHSSQRDLALAYSPGVAEPCLEIAKDVENVYKYTAKGNLVAVITNGTAVLGLGNIGPEASKPVMEGKGLLFKIFAGIDVFDIEIDTTDVNEFVETVKRISPTFGGINLEDIKAPEAFEIEKRLKEELDIPVMHDDQHGTAIISGAALLNAVELAEKKMDEVRIVVNGAGAAAISCAKIYLSLGAKKENIIMLDSKGVLNESREGIGKEKQFFVNKTKLNTLEESVKKADVFVGLSVGNIMTPKMLLSMSKDPIVFAMANPDPEIDYKLAVKTRPDVIMATGRSDYPNQVNNVLGFPFIFRGALDVGATKINEEMKIAAVYTLAEMTKQAVPEQVNIAYGEKNISFGRDYIIPKPFDPRLIVEVPPAVAKAAIKSGVAKSEIKDWDKYNDILLSRVGGESKIVRMLMNRAKTNPKKVVFPEGDQLSILKAAQVVYDEGIAIPILLGSKDVIKSLMEEINFEEDIEIIDPKSKEEKARRLEFAKKYWTKRNRKGVTLYEAERVMRHRNYFAAMMVEENLADALVSGFTRNYPSVLKPMIELIGLLDDVNKVSATNLMLTSRGPLFLSDTAINVDPSSEDIALTTEMTATVARMFGIDPNIALLSFSNFGSSKTPSARKMSDAVKILQNKFPDLVVDGEVQADFALNREKGDSVFPFSKLKGKKTNILIFPNLDSANIAYKIIRELNDADTIGPIILGMKKPVHILQLGSSVDEIVNMVCVAVVDAQEKSKLQNEK